MRANYRKVTLKDLAEATGFSINTVSRVLRNKGDIAPETRRKIMEAQTQMGYVNNSLASSLRRGYTNSIAVILGDIANPHFGVMMSEIERHARQFGYEAILFTTNEDENLEMRAIASALNYNVDGIIICPCQKSNNNITYLKSIGIPFVLIGRRCGNIDTNYVICDDLNGGYVATKELLRNGHQRIMMLQGAPYISSAVERYEGYRKAHEEAGFLPDPALLQVCNVKGSNTALFEEIFSKEPDFTAVFAFSDIIAWDFWTFASDHGYSVPDDFSLVGFDHIQSRLPVPFNLTSVCSYKGRMSVEAVDVLMKKMNDEDDQGSCIHRIIETDLISGVTVRQTGITKNLTKIDQVPAKLLDRQ